MCLSKTLYSVSSSSLLEQLRSIKDSTLSVNFQLICATGRVSDKQNSLFALAVGYGVLGRFF